MALYQLSYDRREGSYLPETARDRNPHAGNALQASGAGAETPDGRGYDAAMTRAVVLTLVALVTDKVFGSPLAVGHSMTIVNAIATALAVVLLFIGCKHFRASLEREALHARVGSDVEAPLETTAPIASNINSIDAPKAF